jgi:release factor glutamine methyltransferase
VSWDGRALLGSLGTNAPRMLSPGGMLLIVHSVVRGVKTTVNTLHQGGLKAAGVARREDPFGPVMLQQIALLSVET